MLHINEDQVLKWLSIPEAINVIRYSMKTVSSRAVNFPNRFAFNVGNGNKLGIMSGAILPESIDEVPCFGAKLVSLFPCNKKRGKSSHQGILVLFDSITGDALATVESGTLTAIRTAAASALATQVLSKSTASQLSIIGSGEQAKWHLASMLAIRPIKVVMICGKTPENIKQFVDEAKRQYPQLNILGTTDIKSCVSESDIICTVTNSKEPVIDSAWVNSGTHINVVGSSFPDSKEISPDLVQRAHLYVDYKPAIICQAGEVIEAIQLGLITEQHIIAELGELLSGKVTIQ